MCRSRCKWGKLIKNCPQLARTHVHVRIRRTLTGAKMTIKDSLCDWTLTAEQMEVPEHQFCFQVSFFQISSHNHSLTKFPARTLV